MFFSLFHRWFLLDFYAIALTSCNFKLQVCGAVCRCMLRDVMSVGTHVITAISREGGGADKHLLFLL